MSGFWWGYLGFVWLCAVGLACIVNIDNRFRALEQQQQAQAEQRSEKCQCCGCKSGQVPDGGMAPPATPEAP